MNRLKAAVLVMLTLALAPIVGLFISFMNLPNDLAVAAGIFGLCLVAIFAPYLYLLVIRYSPSSETPHRDEAIPDPRD